MSDPFIGEVKMWGLKFTPTNWAGCDGQLIPVTQNQSLYSVIGNTYGGTPGNSFGFPDLRGAAPMHWGAAPGFVNRRYGTQGGENTVALQESQLPRHSHVLNGDSQVPESGTPSPNGVMGFLVREGIPDQPYATVTESKLVEMSESAIFPSGDGEGHENMQPFLTFYFCLALDGMYPPRG